MKFKIRQDKMLSHQLQWWNLPNRYRLMVGGYGSGKTYIGALRSIFLSYINKPLPGMYVSPTHGLAQKTIILTLKEIFRRSDIDFTFNQNKGEFRIHNWDGLIWIGSGDKPDSLRGPNLAWAGIDEPFIQKREVFEQMTARVRHPNAVQSEIFMSGTPEELNWGYQLVNDSKIDIGTVNASTLDNPYLPQDYKDSLLAAYSQEQIDAYVHGKFVNLTQGRVYKDFNRDKHMMKRETEGWEIAAGQDYNVDANTVVIFAYTSKVIAVFDEIRLKNSGTYDMAEALKDKYPGIKVMPDSTGSARKTSSSQSDHDIMRQAGFQVLAPRKNPPVRDRVNAVNRLLREERITFNNCPNLIMDMERNVWRNGDIDKRDPEQTHASDAIGYAINWLFPIHERIATVKQW
jgi:PBSX family phage terminase large subunit